MYISRLNVFMLAPLLAALSLCSCTSPTTIDVQYHSAELSTPISGAGRVMVHVQVVDGRISNSRQVGTLSPLGDYREKRAAILSARPVQEIVQQAIVEELQKKGFKVGPSRTAVVAEVNEFYSDTKLALFRAAMIVGEVRLAVQVRDSAGRILYTRTLTGQTKRANAQMALEAALALAISELMSDRTFMQSMLNGGAWQAARTPRS